MSTYINYMPTSLDRLHGHRVSDKIDKPNGAVRIVCVGDTHLVEEKAVIPPCDLFLHAGDILFRSDATMTKGASVEAYTKFCRWLATVPCRRGFVICGNHDRRLLELGRAHLEELLPPHITYLENDAAEAFGLTIFGSPNSVGSSPNSAWQHRCDDNVWEGVQQFRHGERPLDILLAHGPGFYEKRGRLHSHARQVGLLEATGTRLHVNGHLHWAYGVARVKSRIDGSQITSVTCCFMDGSYDPTNSPVVIDMMPRKPAAPAAPAAVAAPVPAAPAAAAKVARRAPSVALLMFNNSRRNHLETLRVLSAALDGAAKVTVFRTAEEASATVRDTPAAQRYTAVVGIGDRTYEALQYWPQKTEGGSPVFKALFSGALCERRERVHAAGIHMLTYSDGKMPEAVADVREFAVHSTAVEPVHVRLSSRWTSTKLQHPLVRFVVPSS